MIEGLFGLAINLVPLVISTEIISSFNQRNAKINAAWS